MIVKVGPSARKGLSPQREPPCGVLPLGRGLLVPSWSDHRIDFYFDCPGFTTRAGNRVEKGVWNFGGIRIHSENLMPESSHGALRFASRTLQKSPIHKLTSRGCSSESRDTTVPRL